MLFKYLSLMKWQSISMCFVVSWKVELDVRYTAACLSQNSGTGLNCLTPNSSSKCSNQSISHDACAMDLYTADDLEMVDCFLDLQERMKSPKKVQKHVTYLLVSPQVPQSASTKQLSTKLQEEEKSEPFPTVPFIYLKILLDAFI